MLNCPLGRVVVVERVPEGSWTTVTVAPATGAPCWLLTNPLIAEEVIPCPKTLLANARLNVQSQPSARFILLDNFMVCSLVCRCRRCRRHHGETQLEPGENGSQDLAAHVARAPWICNCSPRANYARPPATSSPWMHVARAIHRHRAGCTNFHPFLLMGELPRENITSADAAA
jgi:hypothetical protein